MSSVYSLQALLIKAVIHIANEAVIIHASRILHIKAVIHKANEAVLTKNPLP